MAGTYQTVVSSLSMCGLDIARLSVERPPGYEFRAGQWFRLTLPTEEGAQTRTFSHASAPLDSELEMATRLSASAFKRAFAELTAGDTVAIMGPGGRLRLPDDAARVVVLTGGVGVTPVRSLVRDALARGAVFDDALVFFGNRDQECALYVDEFSSYRERGIRVIPVYENPEREWAGETGFITAAMVRRHADEIGGRPFVVTGPPAMVTAMDAVLDELGVDPALRIVESFGV